eukprot:3781199-Amphidinium_carterae.1
MAIRRKTSASKLWTWSLVNASALIYLRRTCKQQPRTTPAGPPPRNTELVPCTINPTVSLGLRDPRWEDSLAPAAIAAAGSTTQVKRAQEFDIGDTSELSDPWGRFRGDTAAS